MHYSEAPTVVPTAPFGIPTPSLTQAQTGALPTLRLFQAYAEHLWVAGVEDHPDKLRGAFGWAGHTSVARVARRRACGTVVASLASLELVRAVATIESLRSGDAMAKCLGVPRTHLAADLRGTAYDVRKFSSLLRVLAASRVLGDTAWTLPRVAHVVGYHSLPALQRAFHQRLAMTATEIRAGGGLWVAAASVT